MTKIAHIETFLLHPGTGKNLLFCRVQTDDGLEGWGEAYVTRGKERVIDSCIHAMADYVIGRSAYSIRHTGQVLFDDFAIRRVSMELLSAWSAIELALWLAAAPANGCACTRTAGRMGQRSMRISSAR
jgi:galactonate dehydratase